MSLPLPPRPSPDMTPGGLLHARVLRPPQVGWSGSHYTGMQLAHCDAAALANYPGVVQVVVRGNFVGVVATEDRLALQAIAQLPVRWKAAATQAANMLPQAVTLQTLAWRGDAEARIDAARGTGATLLEQQYDWRHATALLEADDPALTAIADCHAGGARVWAQLASPRLAQQQIAALLGLPLSFVHIEAQYNDSDRHLRSADELEAATVAAADAAADAALLSAATGRPVSLRLAPQQSSALTLRATARVQAVVDAHLPGQLVAYRHALQGEQALRPPLALMLTGASSPVALADSPTTALTPGVAQLPPYVYPHLALAADAAAWQAGAAYAPAHVFAHESFIDEAARAAGVDPVQYRLRHVVDTRGAALIQGVTQQAGWRHEAAAPSAGKDILRGRGFAYSHVIDADQGGNQYAAWVADVEYDRDSGELSVTRVVVGQDFAVHGDAATGVDPALRLTERSRDALDAARADVQQSVQGLLDQNTAFDTWAQQEYGLAIPTAANVPAVELVGTVPGPVRLQAGNGFSLPAAAAVANAIHDATGVRLRSAPFNTESLRLALARGEGAGKRRPGWKGRTLGMLGGAAATLAGLVVLASPWRAEIKPVAAPDPGLYSAATIARGKLVAAAGDCVVCHTAPNGIPNAGGHALETPFGTVYSTNITPHEKTGIGNWSFAAFERAMREGIHRDGRHLYPAFPYTAFARISDADMQALYAYLMAQPAVDHAPPPTALAFPFGMRPLMAGWNALFHKSEQFTPDASRSAQWNRGAYLVEGAGHCSACHSPRNLLGAEKGGRAYLTGGSADGWEAPALTGLSRAPLPWTETELFNYLRTGYSAQHGVAAGPMAPVVAELALLPADDVRAIAHYLASFNAPQVESSPQPQPQPQQSLQPASLRTASINTAAGANLYQGSCAVCHQGGSGPVLFGVKPSLALNSNLHSSSPDNLIQVILQGIREPANPELGYMPAFADSFNDRQLVDLLQYLRATFAADKPAWPDLAADVARLRKHLRHDASAHAPAEARAALSPTH